MKHFGDITKINGAEVPMVDIITGGSPCQDLSVAGKRAGLKHSDKGDEETTRSGLFMEQIRIVKEMRDECIRQLRVRGADVDIRLLKPRFLVWENVTGAFSSNKGEDFRCVLEEICRIADQTATVPMPEKGKWSTSGCIVGDGWSVAWRVHDAQFWGVPQRRKRIALVADFGSESAGKILFECKSVPGDIAESEHTTEISSTTARGSIDSTSSDVKNLNPWDSQGNQISDSSGKYPTLRGCGNAGYQQGYLFDHTSKKKNDPSEFDGANHKIAGTLDASYYKGCGERQGIEREIICDDSYGIDLYNQAVTGNVSKTLNSIRSDSDHVPCVAQKTVGDKQPLVVKSTEDE